MSHLLRRPVYLSPSGVAVVEETLSVTLLETLSDDRQRDPLPMPDFMERGDEEPFRYCLNTSTLRGHGLPLNEMVDIAAAAGYEAIEPWIDEIERFIDEGGKLKELGARIRDLGLTVEGGIGFFEWIVDDDAVRAEGLKKARYAMGLLAQINGKRIAAPAFGAHDATAAPIDLLQAAERYRTLLEVGDDTGVTPLVEVWGFSRNVSRLGEGALIAMESGHPDASLLADIYHMYKGGSPVSALRHLSPETIGLFHVNDYPDIPPAVITDQDRVYPGDGVAPLSDLFRTLKEVGYRGVLSLELFNTEYYQQEPLSVARTGLEKLRDCVQQAFR